MSSHEEEREVGNMRVRRRGERNVELVAEEAAYKQSATVRVHGTSQRHQPANALTSVGEPNANQPECTKPATNVKKAARATTTQDMFHPSNQETSK